MCSVADVPSLVSCSLVYNSRMEIVRWGVIGAGDIVVRRVAPAIVELPKCEFTAFARNRPDLAETFARETGAKRWYSDWRGMLADPDIDAVYIATPIHLHAEQTITAAQAGKHVLCEKPMAMNPEECEQMIAVCSEHGVKLGIAYYRRFYPVLARIRGILADGEIGRPVIAHMNAFEFVDMNADDPRGWFLQKAKSGGGPMMDFGCHRIEVLTDLFGSATSVRSVVANAFFDREVEDTAVATLRFASGTVGTVTVTHAAREPRDTLDIYGTNGSIQVPVLNKGEITITTPDGVRREHHPPHSNVHLPLISDFAEAVLNVRPPRVGGETGVAVTRLIDEIYKQS